MAVEPRLLAGRFEVHEWIGEGSVGVVHAARDRRTGRDVAVKLAKDASDPAATRRRFDREAAALAVIASAHVVELISAGADDDGRAFLAMERLDGRDLQELLDAHGAFTPERVVRFVDHAARALELAHGLGIVHRDLKPANLFLHRAGPRRLIVKVLDFGLVADVGDDSGRSRDAFGGTPLYMAPEQVRGQLQRIGPATDGWALAMIAVTLLTGETYWGAGGPDDVAREIASAPIEPPSRRWPWLPPTFDAWFGRATARVPERRFRSVG
ncbi:MAG: serine/threonine protein kinase, partial [Myxococcales bacterium]|nr:serine/threonine protein kinase [Myxococcales bacterium]